MKIPNAIKNTLLFTLSLFYLTAGESNAKHSEQLAEEYFLVGSYTKENSEGIYRLKLDHKNHRLENMGLVANAVNPSFLAFEDDPKSIFAVTSDKLGGISHFLWHDAKQEFQLNTFIDGLGQGACHIAINPERSKLAIANYTSGEIHLVSRNLATDELTLSGRFKNVGKGPTARQKSSHMHYVQWDKSGKHLYAIDLGTDEIKFFNSNDKELTAKVAAKMLPGDGPRHLIFHPTSKNVYVVNELSNTIVAFTHDEASGEFSEIARYPTSAETQQGLPSAIRISEDGNFLYAAVRGDKSDHISVFSISNDGKLAHIQTQSSGGSFPRDFNFSEQQNYILIANQYGNSITVLARDTQTGLLSKTAMKVDISTPSFVASHAF